MFNAGNVDQHSLLLGPAERADVVVDFSDFAGQTLILYNDAPAAFPARDPRYDYYTGNADYRDTGGAPSTLPGYGPNTRTVMQIKVNGIPPRPPTLNPAGWQRSTTASRTRRTAAASSSRAAPDHRRAGRLQLGLRHHFQTNGPMDGSAHIFDTSLTFKTLTGAG